MPAHLSSLQAQGRPLSPGGGGQGTAIYQSEREDVNALGREGRNSASLLTFLYLRC